MMALFSGIKFAGIFLLLACYMRSSKCYEIQENYEISDFSDILGRSDHHVHKERARTIMHVGYVAHQAISTMVQIAMEEYNSPHSHCTTNTHPMDCAEIQQQGASIGSGTYQIWPRSRIVSGPIDVWCDMDDEGGGWTVLQRRGNFGRLEDYFWRNWTAYKNGFGDINEDHWLGNDNICAIINQREYSIKFILKDWEGNRTFAQYDSCWIDDEDHNYELHVIGYRGTAGDSFSYANGLSFSTRDRDNDLSQANCAETFKGAWWYGRCHASNLNGLYLGGPHQSYADGVNWRTFRGYHYSLEDSVMMIRPKGYKVNVESIEEVTSATTTVPTTTLEYEE